MVGSYTIGNPTKSYSTTRPVVEIKGGYNLSDYFAMELNLAYAQTRKNNTDQALFKYGGDVLLHLMPEGDFVPFLAFGAGGFNYLESKGGVSTSTNGYIDGGGGIKYQVTDSVALRIDGRINIVTNNTEPKQLVILAGLHFPFGGTKSRAKSPEPLSVEEVRQMEKAAAAPVETQPAPVSRPSAEQAVTAQAAPAEPVIQDAGTPAVPADSTAGTAPALTGSVSAKRTTVVTDIIIGKHFIDILTDSPVADFKTLRLAEPERLAIYLQTSAWGLVKRFIAVNRFGISNIRAGAEPDSVTIVLDSATTDFPAYTIEKRGTGLRISFPSKPVKKVKKQRPAVSK